MRTRLMKVAPKLTDSIFSDGDDEFGAWCSKALASHNDVIDGESQIEKKTLIYLVRISINTLSFPKISSANICVFLT